jgi:diguanylate cyclase (GGDEF)-like protein
MSHSHENTLFLNRVIEIQSRLVRADFNVDSFMQMVVEQMQTLTPATGVVVELIEDQEMVYRAATGTVANYVGLRLAAASSISGLCVRSNQVLRSDDTSSDPRVNAAACKKVGASSLVVAPLTYEGKAIGVLKITSIKPNTFSEDDVNTLQLMAGFIASGLAHQMLYDTNQKLLQERTLALNELEKAQELLKHLALYDSLTNLPNRTLLNEKLLSAISKVKRSKGLIAFMFLDVDHFKTINDTYGHDVGDELLQSFAGRLKNTIRLCDTAARLGGDEFVVLLEDINAREDGIEVAKKILEKMRDTFTFKNVNLKVTTSIGVAFYEGENISQIELIKKADGALYTSKQAGRNTFSIAT